MGLLVCAVSVFKKKSDAVCGFLAYFCAVLRFSDHPYAPLIESEQRQYLIQGAVRLYELTSAMEFYEVDGRIIGQNS